MGALNWDEVVRVQGEKQRRQLLNMYKGWAEDYFSLLECLAEARKKYADDRSKPPARVQARRDRLQSHVVDLMTAGYDGNKLHSRLKARKEVRRDYFSGAGDGDQTLRRDIKAVKRALLKSPAA